MLGLPDIGVGDGLLVQVLGEERQTAEDEDAEIEFQD